jgi:hypothetical protein
MATYSSQADIAGIKHSTFNKKQIAYNGGHADVISFNNDYYAIFHLGFDRNKWEDPQRPDNFINRKLVKSKLNFDEYGEILPLNGVSLNWQAEFTQYDYSFDIRTDLVSFNSVSEKGFYFDFTIINTKNSNQDSFAAQK